MCNTIPLKGLYVLILCSGQICEDYVKTSPLVSRIPKSLYILTPFLFYLACDCFLNSTLLWEGLKIMGFLEVLRSS